LAALHSVMKLLVCNSQKIRRKKVYFIYLFHSPSSHTCDTRHVKFTTHISSSIFTWVFMVFVNPTQMPGFSLRQITAMLPVAIQAHR